MRHFAVVGSGPAGFYTAEALDHRLVGEGRKGMAGGNSGSMKQQGDGQQGMLTNVTDFAMDKPLVTLLSAVAIGFVLGRVTSRHD